MRVHKLAGRTSSTVGEEKQHNLRLTKPKEEFITIMANLGLPYPKKLGVSSPTRQLVRPQLVVSTCNVCSSAIDSKQVHRRKLTTACHLLCPQMWRCLPTWCVASTRGEEQVSAVIQQAGSSMSSVPMCFRRNTRSEQRSCGPSVTSGHAQGRYDADAMS